MQDTLIQNEIAAETVVLSEPSFKVTYYKEISL